MPVVPAPGIVASAKYVTSALLSLSIGFLRRILQLKRRLKPCVLIPTKSSWFELEALFFQVHGFRGAVGSKGSRALYLQ